MDFVTDTHSLVWYLSDDQRLSNKALKSFAEGERTPNSKAPLVTELVCGMMPIRPLAKIKTIDTSAWSEADKTNFSTLLISLKTEIDTYLTAQNPTTPA